MSETYQKQTIVAISQVPANEQAEAAKRLQQLRPSDIEHYHAQVAGMVSKRTKRLISNGTSKIHHYIISSALRAAERDQLVRRNVATLVERPSGRSSMPPQVKAWTIDEVRRVVDAARSACAQTAAFMALALDSGARKGELRGLYWSDIDFETRELRIERQLLREGKKPVFGPPKTRKARKLELSAESIGFLREHKRQQAELKMANRGHYDDHGLVFAQAWEHLHGEGATLGTPFSASTVVLILET